MVEAALEVLKSVKALGVTFDNVKEKIHFIIDCIKT